MYGNVLQPDSIAEEDIEERAEEDLHPSCFRMDGEKREKAPGIIKNHIGLYQDYAICLVPGCESCANKFGVLIPDTSLDANQVVNLRVLFIAKDGSTFFSIDYSNIEVRTAANLSKEPELENIFLYGDGDHHALTASKIFPEYTDPTSKLYKAKSLRAIAKTINFALQYGGTEHAIYEHLKKSRPDLTKEKTQEMVAKYWAGVPKFKEWCDGKQARAREEFTVDTATGRVIDFKSAMEAERIHVPTKEERSRLGHYYDLKREARRAEARATRTASRSTRTPPTDCGRTRRRASATPSSTTSSSATSSASRSTARCRGSAATSCASPSTASACGCRRTPTSRRCSASTARCTTRSTSASRTSTSRSCCRGSPA